jgi:DNA-binding transcriptional ArsR family regulator
MSDTPRPIDARTLRGLAHPLRMRILELLRLEGPATATGLAAALGQNTGTVSWHLRHLAEHGFIEDEPERGTRRERWWRASRERRVLNTSEFRGDPALSVYLDEVIRQQAARVSASYGDADAMGPEWVAARTMTDWTGVRLSADRLAELNAEVTALLQRYSELPDEPDAEVIVLQYQAFPRRSGSVE